MRLYRRILQPALGIVLALVVVGVPLWTVLVTAGKSQAEALSPGLGLPSHWELGENLGRIVEQARVDTALLGSLVLLIPSVLVVLLLGSMAAWVLARRSGRGRPCCTR
ncbi:ABC transporter, permease protein [Actinomyces denticolens]|uniref:hypothetical protein n=1 Tax=Actinomyces denticolens TaxID=52767 RepID=UPI0009D34B43|nr:hypothetical protein [Actinomyces denticolens]GAV93921.1 ABC transporter, permease protein [Actinomyces denticolens]